MPTTVLRPTGTVSNSWTVNLPALSAHDALDDAVLQPTAPSTVGDSVSTDAPGAVCEIALADATLAAGESVTEARLWVYLGTGSKRGHRVSLRHGTTVLATADFPLEAGWQSVASTTSLTQAQVNDLRAHMECVSTGGGKASAITAYVAYVELTTAAAAKIVDAAPVALTTVARLSGQGAARVSGSAAHTMGVAFVGRGARVASAPATALSLMSGMSGSGARRASLSAGLTMQATLLVSFGGVVDAATIALRAHGSWAGAGGNIVQAPAAQLVAGLGMLGSGTRVVGSPMALAMRGDMEGRGVLLVSGGGRLTAQTAFVVSFAGIVESPVLGLAAVLEMAGAGSRIVWLTGALDASFGMQGAGAQPLGALDVALRAEADTLVRMRVEPHTQIGLRVG